jgi:aspartyl-tRNA(Asn)/glutamyl-tRNA(Gln) amidotransferase subunit C
MALTPDQVRKIAHLARLRLTPEEEARFAAQLGQVVEYIDQLARFAPAAPAVEAAAPAGLPEAADAVVPCLAREVFLANAPAAIDGFLLVPAVKARPTPGRASESAPERAPERHA